MDELKNNSTLHLLLENAVDYVKTNEPYSRKPFINDNCDLVIGYGHNLNSSGIDKAEASYLLCCDLRRYALIASHCSWWDELDNARRIAVLDIMYELGPCELDAIQGFRNAMLRCDYECVAELVENSELSVRSPGRAWKNAEILRSGRMPTAKHTN